MNAFELLGYVIIITINESQVTYKNQYEENYIKNKNFYVVAKCQLCTASYMQECGFSLTRILLYSRIIFANKFSLLHIA